MATLLALIPTTAALAGTLLPSSDKTAEGKTAGAEASNGSVGAYQGSLSKTVSAQIDKKSPWIAYVTFNDGIKAKITFLDDGIFRYDVDPTGAFNEYATPRSKDHTAKIQQVPDDSKAYEHPAAAVHETDSALTVTSGDVTLSFEKNTAKMSAARGKTTIFAEAEPLSFSKSATVQKLEKRTGENFFGGGTQNGRFLHTNQKISISNTNSWTNGGVSSPNPYYWTSAGYGVLRNTFSEGSYDFGATDASTVSCTHQEDIFDAYYFVGKSADSNAKTAQTMLRDYFKVTGNPLLLPEYAFYLGHLNAYNRDGWSDQNGSGAKGWTIKDGKPSSSAGETSYEYGRADGYVVPPDKSAESLNGHGPSVSAENFKAKDTPYKYSARAVIDRYDKNDMPFGWFLPNDGYGAGYGQNGYEKTGGVNKDGSSTKERLDAVAGNVKNLQEFTKYANAHGVSTGLWTQSQLNVDSNPDTKWQKLRDFKEEVATGGVTSLKTDVAWVGNGYSFGLNATKQAYDIVTTSVGKRPNIVTLDGWAGSQRYGAIWTGDQYGGEWEYIRFHIPTYIGQSLAGNPNIGSDMDGIFAGAPIISTRDYEWKTFTPLMLDMDGWGTYAKAPYTHGDPYTGISRFYLKLKSQLMPYLYTSAASAGNIDTGNGDTGLPMVRAMLLSDGSDYASSTATQYQYTFGDSFLVAPIYQNTSGKTDGDDVRDNIYLPGGKDDTWIDYLSGRQYRGGQVLNNFDAPLWKLPLFVKANAIIPMYDPNNNPLPESKTNPKGLDKTKRSVEFFATSGKGSYTLFEDDGTSAKNKQDKSDKSYGTIDNVSYGDHVSTKFTSSVKDGTATFAAAKSTGGYSGYDPNRSTTFIVNLSQKPTGLKASSGEGSLKLTEASSKAEFDAAKPASGKAVFFYDEKPNLNTMTPSDEDFSKVKITTTPKLYVKFSKTDVSKSSQKLTVEGFANEGDASPDNLVPELGVPELTAPADQRTPTSITLAWNKIEQGDVTSYDLECDGTLFSVGDVNSYKHGDLAFNSTHRYRIRSRNAQGYSPWSEYLEVKTQPDPWRNVPVPKNTDWEPHTYYSNCKESNAFDHNINGPLFHSDDDAIGKHLTIDYGQAFRFDTFKYYPRDNAGNGTVTKMKIESSLDGTHWKDLGTYDWARDATMKEVDFPDLAVAQYTRLTPLASVGNYFSAAQLEFCKKDGTKPFEVGSTLMNESVTEADYSNMKNYLGLESRDPDTATFNSQIRDHYADLNGNGVYDVYDYAFTMAKLDGGTKRTGKVAGDLAVVPSAGDVKAGDIVTVDLFAEGAKNVNALGALVNFDSSKFEFVADSIAQDPYNATMENLSKAKTSFKNGTQTINLAFANRGDKDLYAGTGAVASFKLKAKVDGKVELPSSSFLIGPGFDCRQLDDDGTIVIPDKPTGVTGQYSQDDFKLSMTNELLPTDDGGNVKKLIQQNSYDGLFNGKESENNFELKWDVDSNRDETGELPAYVTLPTTIHFTFKKPSELDDVHILNRKGGNGTVTSMDATVTFSDGTKQDFSFSGAQDDFALVVSGPNRGKLACGVDITPKTSVGAAASKKHPDNRMLTLRKVTFDYTADVPKVDSVELDKDNAKELYVGDLTTVRATVKPDFPDYPYYRVESSDPSVASVRTIQKADKGLLHCLRGNAAGKATITVTSLLDETKSAHYEITIKEGVDTSGLLAAIDRANSYDASAYTKQSYGKLSSAVDAARKLLAKGDYTKAQVVAAQAAIEKAIDGLKLRPVDPKALINTDKKSPVKVAAFSSEADYESNFAKNVLDYDDSTCWHSDYQHDRKMPQYLIFDLGDSYDLTDVTFLPRQGATNGDIFEAQTWIGNSVDDLIAAGKASDSAAGTATMLGDFKFENNGTTLLNRADYQQMSFGAAKTRYVMLKVLHAGGDATDSYASMSEARFYGTAHVQPTPADKTALKKLYDGYVAENLKKADYTVDSWTPFELAMGDAQRLLAEDDATQHEIDQCAHALKTAHDGLVRSDVPPVPNPTRKDLENLVAKAKKIDLSDKTAKTVKVFKAALASAENVLADEQANDATIKAAYDELKAAIDGLRKKSPEPGPVNPSGGGLSPTGDAALIATATVALAAVVVGGGGVYLSRRQRK